MSTFSIKAQFSADLSPPNPDIEYYCCEITKCKGWTLLHKLVLFPDLFVEYLSKIDNVKVDINVKNNEGWTPLELACRYSNTDSNVETVKLLLENGADVDSKDNEGWTPLIHACRYATSNSETVKLLLENGADVNSKDYLESTPLIHACRFINTYSNVKTVKLLLDNGADVNSNNNSEWTPLMYACCYNTDSGFETVKLLLDNGAGVNSKDGSGWTSLTYLCEQEKPNRKLVIMLSDMGCDAVTEKAKLKIRVILIEEENKMLKSRIAEMQAFKASSASKLFEHLVMDYM